LSWSAASGALAAAALGSACCWLPLFLVTLGVSGLGAASWLEAWRPYFLGATFVLLGAAFYFVYRKPAAASTEACPPSDAGGACCTAEGRDSRRGMKTTLWFVAAAALAFALFPYYAGVFSAASPSPEDASVVEFKVRGMTCGGCAASVEKALSKTPGVASVKVDFDSSKAHVALTKDTPASKETLAAAVAQAGYETKFEEKNP
jgi:copper chaperone CopZ